MSTRVRMISLPLLALGLIVSAGLPRAVQAGVSDTVLALAGPLEPLKIENFRWRE